MYTQFLSEDCNVKISLIILSTSVFVFSLPKLILATVEDLVPLFMASKLLLQDVHSKHGEPFIVCWQVMAKAVISAHVDLPVPPMP